MLGSGLGLSFSANGIARGGRNPLFGVNMSGPEFAPWNGQTFPTAANWTYLASIGVGYVRLPIAWESIQTTLNASLNSTYLGNVQAAIAAAYAKGIRTIVEIHNFGHYISQAKWTASDGVVSGYAGNAGVLATGVNRFGDGTLTSAHLADLWTKLATALTGTPGLMGLGVMNEPTPTIVGTNLLTTPNYFTGANWFALNAGVVTQLTAGTNPLGASYGPAWSLTSGSGFGGVAQNITFAAVPYTISFYARTTSGTQPYAIYISGTSGTGTVTTAWQRFSFTRTPSAGASTAIISINAGSGNTIQIANAQLELGSSPTTYQPSVWTPYAQAAITAIRAVDATVPIYVCGHNYGAAATWVHNNYEISSLTGGNLIFEAHQYFDAAQGGAGGGAYSGTFTSYGVDTNTGAEAVAPFLAWLTARSVSGYLGEFGVPNSVADNDQQWLPTQVAFLNALKTSGVPGTQWFYGSNGVQPSNKLNIVTPGDPRMSQMLAVI